MGRGRGSAGRGRGGRPAVRAGGATTAAPVATVENPPFDQAAEDRARRLQERRDRRDRQGTVNDGETITLTPSTYRNTESGGRIIKFETALGDKIQLAIAPNFGVLTVGFEVNGSHSMIRGLTLGERQAISMRILTEMRKDIRSRPDGQVYSNSAWNVDGYGSERTRAYQAIGFGPVIRGEMYGVVRNGRLRPSNEYGMEVEMR